MRGDTHVRFGGRAEETDREKSRHRASVRPLLLLPRRRHVLVPISYAIIDMFSRKIVGHAVRPSGTSDDVKDVFDKALANEGLLATDAKMPVSLSDRGPQMRSKTIRRFFYDLGITQMFARPKTPADNATIESFFATFKGERLYHGSYDDPIELVSDSDAFVTYYG
ncbi:MAG: DDE-type integrase/transposase/recombinase [Actinobacteria bacterium]|nr:DDE-type integrase/transposase/recombinase [Actinomycetota bacterium]